MRDDPSVTDLVTRARNGDKRAWDEIVERYAPLIWSICRQYRLDDADSQDVGQRVWLRLVSRLASLREPAALPGWLATTTRRECLSARQAAARLPLPSASYIDEGSMTDPVAVPVEEELLLAERNAALREAFSDLPPGCRRLVALLIADPPLSYAEISARLGIKIGSIGPSRSRCLDKLRHHPAIAGLVDADAGLIGSEGAP
jgi:RNA polymerase sigma factor (sigma-70 family)